MTHRQRTVISIELDDSVYGRWPSTLMSYVMEANTGLVNPDPGVSDDFRLDYAGADAAQRDGTAGGHIRRNVSGTRTDYLKEDVQGLFQTTGSAEQPSYEFIIGWRTSLPGTPEDTIRAIRPNEVFGTDGGEGVRTVPVDAVTESSGELRLTGRGR